MPKTRITSFLSCFARAQQLDLRRTYLGHTALCGSKRFPVRDPFFNRIKRSLNTCMNALTGADYTMYPFSTINAKDWRNLMSVYLDAAFFPNLSKLDFLERDINLKLMRKKTD